jgi:putative spermidine/putrescine transport system permease protein
MSLTATVAPEAAPPVAPTPPRDRRQGGRAESRWLLWPPLVFFALALAVPVFALFSQAFSGDNNAFKEAVTMPVFTTALWRTLLMASIVTVVTVLIGAFYAVAVAISPLWLKAFLMAGLLISLWTSIMVRSFGWMLMELPKGAIYWFLDLVGFSPQPLDLYQTTLAMYPAMIGVMLPFAVLPILAAVNGLDKEQLNAATIFGAGPLLTIRAVVLPVLRPALISGGVLIFVMALGFYVTPLLLGGPSNMTLSGVINSQLATGTRDDVGAAMSILLVGGTVAIYLVADRLFKVSEKWG